MADSQERQELRKELDELSREFREELSQLDTGLTREVEIRKFIEKVIL